MNVRPSISRAPEFGMSRAIATEAPFRDPKKGPPKVARMGVSLSVETLADLDRFEAPEDEVLWQVKLEEVRKISGHMLGSHFMVGYENPAVRRGFLARPRLLRILRTDLGHEGSIAPDVRLYEEEIRRRKTSSWRPRGWGCRMVLSMSYPEREQVLRRAGRLAFSEYVAQLVLQGPAS